MRLVVFDMDGTLIDSVALLVEIFIAAFKAADIPPPDDRAVRSISGLTLDVALRRLAPAASADQLTRLIASYRAEYRSHAGGSREPLFPGALEALERLRRRDDTLLAVATGKGFHGAVTLLTAHGIVDWFQSVQTPDHNRGKPDPQMLETAMAKAGAGVGETVMIGDTTHDMEMAKAAGVAAIGVAWGYHQAVDLRAAGADIVIESFAALDAAIDLLLE